MMAVHEVAKHYGVADAFETVPTAARAVLQPNNQYVMRVAHASVIGKRDWTANRVEALLDDPERVPAIEAAGTGQQGSFTACGTTKVRPVLGEEFLLNDARTGERYCSERLWTVGAPEAGAGLLDPTTRSSGRWSQRRG